MSLRSYQHKRNFSKTPEPKGQVSHADAYLFVIQKHGASHLHYDFRLELNGVLKSWAVPKGPSLDPHVKRLAVHVEDHPLEYGSFEGIILKGQYGGGVVMLWDKGTWEPLDKNPKRAYEAGHLRFNLHAEKLNGRWDLIRFKDDKHWFLIKYKDDDARSESSYSIIEDLNKSVISKLTLEEIAEHYKYIWDKKGLKKISIILPKNLKKSPFPDFIKPELATLVDKPPENNEWLHEIKFDGYRILAFKKGNKIDLKSRNNKEWTDIFPTIVKALKSLLVDNVILDGEIVVLDEEGRSDFQLLQNALKSLNSPPLFYFIFDILYLDHYDLRELPLIERKSILKNLLMNTDKLLNYSDHIVSDGPGMLKESCKHALEGIVSKRMDASYVSNRNKSWLKIKCINRQEFVICGYTNPKGERKNFGALLLGIYNKKKKLIYTGNVGTGFNQKSLKNIYDLLIKNKQSESPFSENIPSFSKVEWVNPILVCEVEFTEWTDKGHLRHPSFKGLRLDKKANEVIRENEIPLKNIKKTTQKEEKEKVVLSHPDKILYLEDKITKQDLFNYYEAISDYILPYVTLRPLTLVRCPEGYQKCFYQRHFNKTTPDTLHSLKTEDEKENYIYISDKSGLLSLVQMGVLEIHPWGSRIEHLEKPDVIIFDLDPAPDVTWEKVVNAALEMRKYLSQCQLQSFVKSTGGKGLHVVVPIEPHYGWEEVKAFSHSFVETLEKLKPESYISKMTKAKRTGKIFIDYLRNQRTATAVSAYSTRARVHAPVSVPLFWEELSSRREDNLYTIKNVLKRLKHLKEDPWKDFWSIKQSLIIKE